MKFALPIISLILSAFPATAFQPMFFAPGKPSGSFLGISVMEIDSERAKALNLKEEHGVEVTRVEEDSPAAKGGVKVGDAVLEYNGQRVEGVAQFMRMVQETPAGRDVKLSISRSGSTETLAVKTAPRKSLPLMEMSRVEIPDVRWPDMARPYMSWRSTVFGIEAESLDSQLAEYFGVKEGVLVRSVTKGSAAEKAGLKAGDVIVKIENSTITTPRDLSGTIRSAGRGKPLSVQIVRERKEMNLTFAADNLDPPQVLPGRSIRR